ncbi:PIN domain-containing protein [Streptomyces sp. BE230]|uniref:PIN domain-containing protein n=1 Tax=Streptomyces sp. BE230 TaxID=3002526 RepID=UPI002ED48EFB|nr:PIN domain-containing protein [Streptomyces sp. BE230]
MPETSDVRVPPVLAVDTNAFYGDLELQNQAWNTTLLRCSRGQLRLWIPEVVVREVVRLHARRLEEAIRNMRTGLSGVRGLRLAEGIVPDHNELERNVRSKAEGYETRLRSALSNAGATILPFPSVPHEVLLRRAMSETKPFRMKARDPENKGPDGYRDVLIWLSIAEAAAALSSSDLLVFVTANHTDFCDGTRDDTSVSPSLLADLSVPVPQVKRCAALQHALDGLPEASVTDEVGELLIDPATSTREVILEWVKDACAKSLPGAGVNDDDFSSGYTFEGLSLPGALENPTIEYIDLGEGTLDWSVYETYEEGTQLASVTIEAEVQFDGFAQKSADLDGLEVHDSNWNDHMVWAYITQPARLTFNVTLDPQAGVVDLVFEGGEAI